MRIHRIGDQAYPNDLSYLWIIQPIITPIETTPATELQVMTQSSLSADD